MAVKTASHVLALYPPRFLQLFPMLLRFSADKFAYRQSR
jgi:hypothetical protein